LQHATLWVQELDASATGAPTAANGAAYVVTRNATGWAVDAATGRILWQVFGAPSDSDILGGPSPAIAGPLVVFPFASGQMIAVVASTGSTAWVASVAGRRPERAFSRVSDLSGDPVYDGTRVYAGNHSGRMAAVDAGTGQLAWSANEGALSPVWRAGDSVFALTDENRLVRLDAANGEILWTAELPLFTRDRIRRRKATFAHFGPILAGGRLIVVSDDQQMREYDPASGALIALRDLPDGAARNPVVAAGTLYLVTANGQLHAFR
jgi:outer membrane protein assembly factor BamB